jgi:hypothetical protein
MYFLLVFGDNVEDFLRPLRYLALIALAAFIGDLAHIAIDPHSQIPCIGASGGIAGVITFYALNFPRVWLGFSDAVGPCLVSMDPVAGMVGFHLVDFVSNHRGYRTDGRDQFRLIGGPFGRRGSWRYRVVALEKAQDAR